MGENKEIKGKNNNSAPHMCSSTYRIHQDTREHVYTNAHLPLAKFPRKSTGRHQNTQPMTYILLPNREIKDGGHGRAPSQTLACRWNKGKGGDGGRYIARRRTRKKEEGVEANSNRELLFSPLIPPLSAILTANNCLFK